MYLSVAKFIKMADSFRFSAFVILAFASFTSTLADDEDFIYPGLHRYERHDFKADVGEPLYLSPYIEAGDISTAKTLSRVTAPLDGVEGDDYPDSYSGYITVDNATDSHMFFWFFPANVTDYTQAPVVVWLQGGPGTSSMFGLLEIHGPISAVYNESNSNDTIVVPNPYSWTNEANMIYIDNPVGTGYSYTGGDAYVTTQTEVGENLYAMIIQWLKLFPELQSNPFFVFGESYGGKYVPTISKKIHDENQLSPEIFINFQGLSVGNGAMSPEDQHLYGHMLHALSLINENAQTECQGYEAQMQHHTSTGNYSLAFLDWSNEVNYFLREMGCNTYLDIRVCRTPDEENNYKDFMNKESTRIAVHVGDIPFGIHSGQVYNNLINDIMRSERETVEFLLERYPVLFYNGNMDIVCHHTGVVKMFEAMENWSGRFEFANTNSVHWNVNQDADVDKEIAGYLTSVDNLRLLAVRNAGHMVPRSQPVVGLEMFRQFLSGTL